MARTSFQRLQEQKKALRAIKKQLRNVQTPAEKAERELTRLIARKTPLEPNDLTKVGNYFGEMQSAIRALDGISTAGIQLVVSA